MVLCLLLCPSSFAVIPRNLGSSLNIAVMTTLESDGSSFIATNSKKMTSHTGRSVTAFAEIQIQSTPIFCGEPELGSGEGGKVKEERKETATGGRPRPA